MTPTRSTYTAFTGTKKLIEGTKSQVSLEIRTHLKKKPEAAILIFEDQTGKQVDFDLREAGEEKEEPKTGPGRPKLGVITREVGLLPRHWEWLSAQPGGASITLRKLVEEARKKNQSKDQERLAQEATHRFMTAMAGDLPGYEEVLRAFYAKREEQFLERIADWPKDVREYTLKLANSVPDED